MSLFSQRGVGGTSAGSSTSTLNCGSSSVPTPLLPAPSEIPVTGCLSAAGAVRRLRGKGYVAAVEQQLLDPSVISLEREVLQQFTAFILNYKEVQEESEQKPD